MFSDLGCSLLGVLLWRLFAVLLMLFVSLGWGVIFECFCALVAFDFVFKCLWNVLSFFA